MIAAIRSSRATLRRVVRPTPPSMSSRAFHLDGAAAATFLRNRLSNIDVRKQAAATADASSSQQTQTTKTPPVKAIKVLLHADRRPKALPSPNPSEPIRTHFGPALLGCHSSYLRDVDADQLGQGDLGILRVQQQHPSRVVDLPIDLHTGLRLDKAFGFLLRMAPIAGMSVPEPVQWQAAEVLQRMHDEVFAKCAGVWFTFDLSFDDRGGIAINEPFFEFDDFGLTKVPELKELFENRSRDENTAKAEDGGLFYIKLPSGGSVGSFGYGAGNAMATMDGLSLAGGVPANFLDGGGGANKANSRLAIETLNRDDDVKSIFVNTFGGITQTDVVAEGVIEAVRENSIKKPIVVRMLGTGAEKARDVLQNSGLQFTIVDDFKEAAREAVARSQA